MTVIQSETHQLAAAAVDAIELALWGELLDAHRVIAEARFLDSLDDDDAPAIFFASDVRGGRRMGGAA